MVRFLIAVLVAVGVVTLAPASAAPSHSTFACHASAIQYRVATKSPGGVAGVPWIASTNSAFRGYLFYFGGTTWARTRPREVRIFTTRAHERVNPKVLWVALRSAGSSLAIAGIRLDGQGSFSARYPAAIGGGQFPSYVRVPSAGCWRVNLRSGSLHGSVTFLATDTA